MAVFAYEALDTKGGKRKGFRKQTHPDSLRQQLRSDGLAPVSIEPATEKSSTEQRSVSFSLFEKNATAS